MPFDNRHNQLLENMTDANWYQVNGVENEDWICSDAMSYMDAMALQRGFHSEVQAQLWPSNSQPGLFRVGVYSPGLTQMMNNGQAFFLNDYNSQNNFHRKIQNAANIEDLIKIINEHPAKMLSSGGEEIRKDLQIAAIRNQQNPAYSATKITSNYGLEKKVVELILQERKLKNAAQRPLPLPPESAKQEPSLPPKDGMLKVSKEEWDRAEAYFAQDFSNNPHLDPTKMKKSKGPNSRSFIKVGDEIYVMASRQCFDKEKHVKLGEGAFGKVKVVQARNGDNFAVKVEGRGARGDQDAETKIGKILDFVKGEAERNLAYAKEFKGKFTIQKLYTVMQLKKGNELFKELYLDPNAQQRSGKFNETQSLIIALKACKSIDELHKLNIIHSDIKPENFMSNVHGNMITIGAIDFGLSSILEPGQEAIYSDHSYGTQLYMAPEVNALESRGPFPYSKASDVYSLGVMLKDDLQMPRHIYEKMLTRDPGSRATLSEVMNDLATELSKQKGLDDEARKVIAEFGGTIPTPPSGADSINNLLAKDYANLTNEYAKLRDGKEAGAIGWARARAKDVGGVFTNVGQRRVEQIADLSRAFDMIKNDKLSTDAVKTELTYGYLLNLRNNIGSEENTFKSGLRQLCDQYIKQIDDFVGIEQAHYLKTDPSVLEQGKQLQRAIRPSKENEQVVRFDNKKKV